jgi:Spy/CpxP family protein refolding chaperone
MIGFFKKKEFIRWFIISLAVINIASLGTIFYYSLNHPKVKKHIYDKRLHAFDFLQKKLDLTDSQQEKIKSFQESHFEKTHNLHKKVGTLRSKLFEEMSSINSDSLLIESTIKEMGGHRSQLEREMAYHFSEMKSVLTIAQQKKFKKLMKRIKKRHNKRSKYKRNHQRKKRPEPEIPTSHPERREL